MNSLVKLILVLAATIGLVSGCSKASAIRGVWEAPTGASLEITGDKWITKAGPMQVTINYTVESTETNTVVVALDDGGDRKANATLTLEGDKLTISGNSVYGGTWTRK